MNTSACVVRSGVTLLLCSILGSATVAAPFQEITHEHSRDGGDEHSHVDPVEEGVLPRSAVPSAVKPHGVAAEDDQAAEDGPQTDEQPLSLQDVLDSFGPSIELYANSIGRVDDRRVENHEGERVDDRFYFRELELNIRSQLGEWGEGVVVLASHAETPGEFETGVEEAFVTLLDPPLLQDAIPGELHVGIGRFRSHFGRLNRLHTHAFPAPLRSLAFENFFGEEGLVSDGVRSSLLHESDGGSIQATVEVFNGGGFPIAAENDNEDPAFVGRLFATTELADGHSLELGTSVYRGAFDLESTRRSLLVGTDLAYVWRGEEGRLVRVATEAYYGSVSGHGEEEGEQDEEEDPGHGEFESPLSPSSPCGFTARAELWFTDRTALTGRFDWTELLVDEDEESRRLGLFLTHFPLDDVRFRIGYERTLSTEDEFDGLDTGLLEVQFRFGKHRKGHDH